MDIVDEMRGLEIGHEPEGWPSVKMRKISALCDEIDRLRKICMKAKESLYAGTKDGREVADMLEAVFQKANAIAQGREHSERPAGAEG